MEKPMVNENDEIDLLELAASCYRRKFMIILFFIVAVALAVGYLCIAVPTYEASVTIMVKPISESSSSLSSLLSGSTMGSSSKITTEVELMKSRRNLNNALSMLDLDSYQTKDGTKYSEFEKPLSAISMEDKVTVSTVKDTSLVEITVSDSSPEFACDYANALAISYNELLTQIARKATQTSLDFLDAQIPINLKETEEATRALAEFQVKNNILQVTQDSKEALLEYNYLLKRRAPLELEVAKADAIINSYTGLISQSDIEANDKVMALMADIESAQEEVLKYDLLNLSAQSTSAKSILNSSQESRYFNLNQSIESLDKALTALITDMVDADRATATQYAKAMCQKIKAELEIKLINIEADKNNAFLETVPEIERQLSELQTQVEIYTKMSVSLMQMLQEAKLKDSAISDNVSEIDLAEVPEKPVSPKKAMILLVAGFAGICLGCLLAIVLEWNDKAFYTIEDVKKELPSDIPFLGWIPMLKRKAHERYFGSVVLNQPNSFESERYKHIASTALFGNKGRKRVISVCASEKNIGKTSVMVNISVSFAQQGYKVLLVDGDLRMPSCETFFNIEGAGYGIVDAVMDNVPLNECIIQPIPNFENLHLLPCGTRPKVPSVVFAQESFTNVLNKLKERYDIIVIDAPPLTFASELLNILNVSTAAICVLRAGISQKDYFEDLMNTLKGTSVNILGVCLNGYIYQRGHNSGSYGYGYGYYSQKTDDVEGIKSIVKGVGLFSSRRRYYRKRYKQDMKYREKKSNFAKVERIYPYLDKENT